MEKPQVLFIGDLNQDLIEYKSFAQDYDCIHYEITTREQLIEDFKTKLSKVEAIYGAWLGFHLIGGFNKELIDLAPQSLQIITVCSVGYDGYDTMEMAKNGITLTNTPALGSEYVADLVLYHTLSSFRFFNIFEKNLLVTGNTIKTRTILQNKYLDSQTGEIKQEPSMLQNSYAFGHHIGSNFPITSPRGNTLTIVGFGSIGIKIASRLANLGMNICYIKRTRLPELEESNLPFKVTYYKSLIDAAPVSNLVIFAVPGNSETRNMFNKQVIDLLPQRSRVINVGRGFIINDEDLLEGLQKGKLVYAGLDVFNGEPEVDQRLLQRQDVLCTPHIGSSTIETYNDSAVYCLKNIRNKLEGVDVQSRVN